MNSTLLETAEYNQQRAWQIIRDTKVMECWQCIGAEINLVGSLRTGLLMKNRDIDFHIYTNPFSLSDSFAAISRLAQNERIKRIEYANLLDVDDRCLEWHAWYLDAADELWHMDMIHILRDSRLCGVF